MHCWFIKWRIACRIDDDKVLGPGLDQHLARCLPCRHYYRLQFRISELLSEASSEGVPAHATSFVHRATGKDSSTVHGRIRLSYATTLAACLVIAIGLVTAVLKTDTLAIPPEVEISRYTQQLTPGKLPVLSAALLRNSIGSEINHIATDVRETAQFLIRCTPYDGYLKKKEGKKIRG